MISIAPPCAVVMVDDNSPHTMRYVFSAGFALTPTGVATVTAAAASYLTPATIKAIGTEQVRNGGILGVAAAIIGAKSGSWPVANVDAITQSAALVTLIATAGNAG